MKHSQNKLRSFREYFKYATSFYYAENGWSVKIIFLIILILKVMPCFSYIEVMQPVTNAISALISEGVSDLDVLMQETSKYLNVTAYYSTQLDFFVSEMWTLVSLGLYCIICLAQVRSISVDTQNVTMVVRVGIIRLILLGILWAAMYFAGMLLFVVPAIIVFYTAIFCFCHLADAGAPANAHIIEAFSVSKGIRGRLVLYTVIMWIAIMIPTFLAVTIASAYSQYLGCAAYIFGDTIRLICTCRMMVAVYNDVTPYKDVKIEPPQGII